MFILYIPPSNDRPCEHHEFETVAECVALGDEIAEDRKYSVERARDRKLMLVANARAKHRFF